jgi:hypothetical protein
MRLIRSSASARCRMLAVSLNLAMAQPIAHRLKVLDAAAVAQ